MPPNLSEFIFWVAVACCVVAQIAIVRASIAPQRQDPSGAGVPRPARATELVWVILPALMLALVLLWTWRAIDETPHVHSSTAEASALAGHGGSE